MRLNLMLVSALMFGLPGLLPAQSSNYYIRDYGALGEIDQLVTGMIQQAIDDCHQDGGGRVYFTPGDYLTGTLILKSNVELYLEAGATLFASQNAADYDVDFNIYKGDNPDTDVLIYANQAQNIAISGRGTIHGQARREYRKAESVDNFIADETANAREAGVEMKRYYKIPPIVNLVYLVDSEDIKISQVTIKESVGWTLHLQWCHRVVVDNCFIYSDLESGVNADGIDVDGSKNVMIANCRIETGDDAIVLKTTLTNSRSETCENVTVTNCVLTSTSSALKLGTESHSDFRHITFDNCVIRNTNRGLSIVIRDGATAENVLFSNITLACDRKHFNWWGNGDPIWLVVRKRNKDSRIGKIRNVVFDNIIAQAQGTSKIEGYPDVKSIENITIRNFKLHMEPEDKPDKRATHALMAQDIKNLTLENVEVSWDTENPEPAWADALHLNKAKGVTINQFKGVSGGLSPEAQMISLRNVLAAKIMNCELSQPQEHLLKVSGSQTDKIILLQNNLFNRATNLVLQDMGVPEGAVQVK
jgi:polygalacturonase